MGEDISDPAAPSAGTGVPAQARSPSGLTVGTSNGHGNGSQQTTDVAKEQAADVADSAKQAGAQVTQTVKEQAAEVTNEAGRQAKQLLADAQSELSEQAALQQQKVAGGLQALADELDGMVRGSEQDGVATDLARQAAERARQVGIWLEDRDPGSLLDEVRNFGRRRPGAYLAIAAGAGSWPGGGARPERVQRQHPFPASHATGDGHHKWVTRSGDRTRSGDADRPYSPAGATAEPSLRARPGWLSARLGPDRSTPRLVFLPSVTIHHPPVQVAPGPVPGFGATNVVGGPRGDLSR